MYISHRFITGEPSNDEAQPRLRQQVVGCSALLSCFWLRCSHEPPLDNERNFTITAASPITVPTSSAPRSGSVEHQGQALSTYTLPSMSASHLAQHVIYDLAVLVLRAEQDDLGISADFYRVSRRPVEQVTPVDHFLCAVCVGDGEFTL